MRYFAVVFLFGCLSAAQNQPCVVLKRASGLDHNWSGIEFYYVAGQYPDGYKFRTNLRGRHVRELVKKGGRFVVVEPNYSRSELEQAEQSCKIAEKAEK
jgi:hypothetical protein